MRMGDECPSKKEGPRTLGRGSLRGGFSLPVTYFHFQPMPALMPHSLPVVERPAPQDILPSSDSALKVSATAL